MNRNNLRVIVAVVASMLFAGFTAKAAEVADVRPVSGEITWVDTKLGKLQLENDVPQGTGEIAEYRISEHETRVTDPADKKFLSVADLWPGQHVTVDAVKGEEDKIVLKITVAPRPVSDLQEAYGEIESVDALTGTLVLTARSRVGGTVEIDFFHFVFEPKDVIAMRSPSREPVQLEVKPGDLIKVEFVVKDGKRWARSITLYPPRVMSTTTTTTVTTTR